MKQDFMPHWKDEERCYEEAKVEGKDERGKKIIMHWPRNKPIEQVTYENWLEKAFNPETNEFHPKRDKVTGNIIKGTGAKHVVTQIVRLRRRDGSEYLYSKGIVTGFDAFGDEIHETCQNPEVWNRPHFIYKKEFNPKTHSQTNDLLI